MEEKLAICFKPFGKVITSRNFEKDMFNKLFGDAITEPPSPHCFGQHYWGITSVTIPIEELKTIIENIILEKLKKKNDELLEDNNKQRSQLSENTFFYVIPENYPEIEEISIYKKNPFRWKVSIKHKIPERDKDLPEYIYELYIKQDLKLFVDFYICIYKRGENYIIDTHRTKGKSIALRIFRSILKEELQRKESNYIRYKNRKSLIMLSEGINIVKPEYITIEIIVKEICSFISEES